MATSLQSLGKIALGSKVRHLADALTREARQIYPLYGIEMNPKWFPVFYVLSNSREKTITAIAKEIEHSHVSVSKIVREMKAAGLVEDRACAEDARRTLVTLARAGRRIAERIEDQYVDVRAALEEISTGAEHDLWKALEEWEGLLEAKSLVDRVADAKTRREASAVRVVPYRPAHREAFRALNEEWIETHFALERPDREVLSDPERYILARGGSIFVAVRNGEVVGVCALIKREDETYPLELAKMAVAPGHRGHRIGERLGRRVIAEARALGAERLFLESNTVLEPAIRLYRKLGFRKIEGPATPYARCNIQMELPL